MELLELCGVQRLGLELHQLCSRAILLLEHVRLLVRRCCSLRHLEGESKAIYAGGYTSNGVVGFAADVLAGSAMIPNSE